MAIKWTILGGLICAAMAFYLAGGLLLAARRRGAGSAAFVGGFTVAAVAFSLRWDEVGHAPLQNMFEVFLCLGVAIWPLSLFCRRLLGAGSEWFNAFLGFVILFPAALVFSAEPEHLPPALQSFLFIPHVAAYMLSYVIMAMALMPAIQTWIAQRRTRNGEELQEVESLSSEGRVPSSELPPDIQAHRLVMLGFPLLTLGLALGSWWGKMAWGDYWHWDPKELWSLVSWLIYLGYFHFRYMFGRRYPRVLSAFILVGLAAIIITLLWVNLSHIFGGMHSYAR